MKLGFFNTILLGASAFGLTLPHSAIAAAPMAVTLSWTAPTTNTDGSALNDLRNFELKVGRASRQYSQSYNSGLNTSYDLSLDLGVYCFSVSAFDTSGNESPPSDELCATIAENGPTPTDPPPGGVSSGRTIPLDFTGNGVSNILTISRKSRGNKSDLLFKIFKSSDFSKLQELTLGKVGDMAAPADYDGDGKVDLAVIQKIKKSWNWKVRQADGSSVDTQFGVARDIPLAGCYFDGDYKAELAVLAKGGKLSFIGSTDGARRDVTLQGAPKSISSLNCADLTGDGLDELILVGKIPASKVKTGAATVKTVVSLGLFSFNAVTGEKISVLKIKGAKSLIAGDLNNDSLAEAAVQNKSSLEFYMQGDSAATPVKISARAGLVASKLTQSAGRVADALLYLKPRLLKVYKFNFSDLTESESTLSLDKRSKEKLVGAVNSSLTH